MYRICVECVDVAWICGELRRIEKRKAEAVALFALPVRHVRVGVRWLPLVNPLGRSLSGCGLLVRVEEESLGLLVKTMPSEALHSIEDFIVNSDNTYGQSQVSEINLDQLHSASMR